MGDFLIHNAKIYQSGRPDKTWMTFSRSTGRVIRLGETDPPLDDFTEDNKQDYKGLRILPGLHDSHIHVSSIGKALLAIDLKGCKSVEEFQQRIKDYAEKNPKRAWLTGRHWEQDVMGRYPTREDIDSVLADRPVLLHRSCGHVTVANSTALQLAGITADTPDPDGGVIDRYPAGHPRAGEPTGILRESPAYQSVLNLIENTDDEIKQWITMGMQYCVEHGLTAVHSNEPPYWQQFCDLAAEEKLPIRTFLAAYYTGRNCGSFPEPGETHGSHLSCDRIKIFSDGALGSATARMSLPYKGHDCSNCGVFIYSQDELNFLVHDATSRGYRLEIHVIGDAAAEAALTAIEAADVAPQRRPILTHCQILSEHLLPRMVACGAIANIQPQFVYTDARWLGGLLNDKLMDYAYPWKTLLDKGIPCSGGSDAPVEPAEPFLGIYDAIFRPSGDRDPQKIQTFRPEECLSVQQAIDLYTTGGAYTTMKEHELGQLRPGYLADFVVIASPTDVVARPAEFLEAKAQEVWVGGKKRYERKV